MRASGKPYETAVLLYTVYMLILHLKFYTVYIYTLGLLDDWTHGYKQTFIILSYIIRSISLGSEKKKVARSLSAAAERLVYYENFRRERHHYNL